MDTIAAETWTCPTCGRAQHARYCADCGERALHAHDLTVLGLGEQMAEAFVHVDGRVFQTFRSLVMRPGLLTEAYVRGQRKPFLAPLQVFLIANVLFFGFQSLFHASVFSKSLASQVHEQNYREFATRVVNARLSALHTTEDEYAPAFDHASTVNAKSLIILMTPPMALLTGVLFYRRRRPFVTHVVFALHFYAFWLLSFLALAPVLAVLVGAGMFVTGIRLSPSTLDITISLILLGCGAAYLFVAARRVYAERGAGLVVKVLVLSVAAGFTVIGYRFAIFLITLYTTGSH